MFIGHFALGLAGKKIAPRVSLGTLFLSVQLLDLLWPIFLLLGIEHVRIEPGNTAFTPFDFYDYPISHSLVTALGWSFLLGATYYFFRHYKKGAWLIAIGVFSHWVLDFVTHRPDMPIAPGLHTYVGLGLWNSAPATIIVESSMFIIGVVLYARSTDALDRIGSYAFWGLMALLSIFYVLSIVSEPPTEQATAVGSMFLWLLIPWARWIDNHRRFHRRPA